MSATKAQTSYEPDQRAFFDALITEKWNLYSSREWDRLRRFEVARLFRQARPRTILDVGCGCGFHDAEMASYPFVEKVDGLDYSPKSVERAEIAYPHPKVRRVAADIRDWTSERPYDLAVSFQVVEHTEDPAEFLRDCARHCRKGGLVAAFTVRLMRPHNRKRRKAGKAPLLEDPMHKQEFAAEDMPRLGKEAGLIFRGGFSYLAEDRRIPPMLRPWMGCWFPSLASRLAAFYQKPAD